MTDQDVDNQEIVKRVLHGLDEELEGQDELLAMKDQVEGLKSVVNTIDSQINELTEKAKDESLSEVGRKKLELNIAEFKEQKNKANEGIEETQKAIAILERERNRERNFDKRILFTNIRELLKNSDVKLGQIEKEAGCQPGYMSRLEKEGNTTDPSVEFVVAAAKLFDINVDILINTVLNRQTPTEKYVMNFIKKLQKDTRSDQITWIRETMSSICSSNDPSDYYHPLFKWVEGYDDEGNDSNYFCYSSSFYPDCEVTLYGNCYHATLPGSNAEIYFMSCKKTFGEGFDAEDKKYYEVYIINKGEITPICCSATVNEPVAIAMDGLYKEAEMSATHVHINKKARDAIDDYLNFEEVPF